MLSIKKITVLVSLFFSFFSIVTAQEIPLQRHCRSTLHEPVFTYSQAKSYLSNRRVNAMNRTNISNLPVIVHVIYNLDEKNTKHNNISSEQILSQINSTNRDLLHQNNNRTQTLDEFSSDAVNSLVELKMAVYSPDGQVLVEPGINRIQGSLKGDDEYSISQVDQIIADNIWDHEKYMNIWVVPLTNNWLGYAYFPNYTDLQGLDQVSNGEVATSSRDGIVIDTHFFGSNEFDEGYDLENHYDLGRTLTHELGHYLGLLHIWGVGSASCSKDDYCDDTPQISSSHSGSRYCNATTGEEVKLLCDSAALIFDSSQYQNYMDYTNDSCMTMFSLDQKSRIDVILTDAPARNTLNQNMPTGTITLEVNPGTDLNALTWTISEDDNVSGFIVEKSINKQGYKIISAILSPNDNAFSVTSESVDTRVTYRVYAVNNTGASFSKSSNTITIYNGIVGLDTKQREKFTIYPNPSEGIFKLKPAQYISQCGLLEVWSSSGALILSKEINTSSAEVSIDLSSYPRGTYFMKLSSDLGVFTQRCIKL
ncbi:T9SS type A sorting domain-containing protein [Flammeovirga pectinis]|uniref:T9SS type A sorting domain-containing protein n=1 Tax=Flammeovirga pectinis TaxID=2494373 RepID=A0A3Q9FP66_9BACT|nr:M43 family zinc metalloprotease [Flammeovirga pectinis]AZQ63169.1 T9SS type A sorting domain-containing protein [Flammeovirga pectinis]